MYWDTRQGLVIVPGEANGSEGAGRVSGIVATGGGDVGGAFEVQETEGEVTQSSEITAYARSRCGLPVYRCVTRRSMHSTCVNLGQWQSPVSSVEARRQRCSTRWLCPVGSLACVITVSGSANSVTISACKVDWFSLTTIR